MIAEPALIKKASLAIFAKRSAQQNVLTKTQHNPRTRTEIQNDGPGGRGTGTVFGSAPVYTGSIHRPEAFIKSLEGQFVPLNLIRLGVGSTIVPGDVPETTRRVAVWRLFIIQSLEGGRLSGAASDDGQLVISDCSARFR
jgi:hypothetical protein